MSSSQAEHYAKKKQTFLGIIIKIYSIEIMEAK